MTGLRSDSTLSNAQNGLEIAQVGGTPAEYDGCPSLAQHAQGAHAMRRWIRFAPAAATIAVVIETMGAGHKW